MRHHAYWFPLLLTGILLPVAALVPVRFGPEPVLVSDTSWWVDNQPALIGVAVVAIGVLATARWYRWPVGVTIACLLGSVVGGLVLALASSMSSGMDLVRSVAGTLLVIGVCLGIYWHYSKPANRVLAVSAVALMSLAAGMLILSYLRMPVGSLLLVIGFAALAWHERSRTLAVTTAGFLLVTAASSRVIGAHAPETPELQFLSQAQYIQQFSAPAHWDVVAAPTILLVGALVALLLRERADRPT